ncbi:MAG: UvrD-helicase domain-containing protein [bacterium]|nr:UvrD-helicase domain-containing protein [bacterium]
MNADLVQRLAADPALSVPLRASAGSGKTKVLVDRIVRLLLVRAPLKSVVALTFTRKAAVEIRDRLRARLGALARLDRDGLVAELTALLGEAPAPETVDRAALLFEEVLEDASGLLVGTIHTFCQTLLKRFADEAGIDPSFSIVENTDDLWDEALSRLEAELARDPVGAAELAELAGDPAAARRMLRGFEHVRPDLDRWLARVARETGRDGVSEHDPDRASDLAAPLQRDLARHLLRGTPLADSPDPTPEALRGPAALIARGYAAGLDAVERTEPPGGRSKLPREMQDRRDAALAAAAALEGGEPLDGTLAGLLLLALTKGGTPRWPRSGAKAAKPERDAAYAVAARPLQELAAWRDLVALYRHNALRLRLGLRGLDHYAALKARDRCLDFHDLERLARDLVRDGEIGPWILYRLDARLDHLLVDEFQDTNRSQWEILETFAQEFLAGDAEDGRPRSVFVVGDVKQSIYGFRGAQPGIFAEVERWLFDRTEQEALTLPVNYRSLPAIVDTVGDLFQAEPLRDLLPSALEVAAARQTPFRSDGPGRVLLLPQVEDREGGDGSRHAAAAALAARVIRRYLAHGTVHEDGRDRPARYGDVLVLARTRTHLQDYEAAFRAAGIPIVPAGRGALARSREVQDVLQLLRWLVFPTDDAALAGVLRSPLVRLEEREFQELLARRRARRGRAALWDALRDAADGSPLAATAALLQGWLRAVGHVPAHRLLRRILRETEAPSRFAAALGEQARYNLLRLHDLALAHEQSAFPSLRTFLAAVENAALREDQEEAVLPDTEQGRVRMMTIHGAKGLEAPCVLLVDAADPMAREETTFVLEAGKSGGGPVVQGVLKQHRGATGDDDDDDDDDGGVGAAGTPLAAAAARRLDEQRHEQANLLYVAMTRARDELVVLGAAPERNSRSPSFLGWLAASPRGLDALPDDLLAGGSPLPASADAAATNGPSLWEPTGWEPLIDTLSPSASAAPPLAGDATPDDAAPGDDLLAPETADGADDEARSLARDAAMAHGTAVHRWLQFAVESGAMPAGDGPAHAEAAAVFANPALDAIFRPAGGRVLCEAAVLARLPRDGDGPERRLLGAVDLLHLGDAEIVVVDYKTNRVAEADLGPVVAHYRPQMQAYREALRACRPGLPVRCLLLFTGLAGAGGPGRLVAVD